MLRFLARRVLLAALVVLLVMVALALLTRLIPGDPVQTMLGPLATPELAAQVRAQMGLDQSVPLQVWTFVTHAVRGDLGTDFVTGVPVATLALNALPSTLILAVASLVIAAAAGIPLGVFAATHRGSLLDRVLSIGSVALITLPPYVAGLLLLLLFAVQRPWFPAIGIGSLSDPLDYLRHLVLPAVALAIAWVGYLARLLRTSMIEVMGTTYVRAATSSGIPPRRVHYRLALRNAVIPTVAVLGVGLGSLIGGTIFVEVIFARAGLGTLLYDAIRARNYPVVRGCTLVVVVCAIAANLLADISYRLLDPRLRGAPSRTGAR